MGSRPDDFGQPDPYFVLSDANGTLATRLRSETQTPTLGGFSILGLRDVVQHRVDGDTFDDFWGRLTLWPKRVAT